MMSMETISSWLWHRGISIGEVAMITGASMEKSWRTVRGKADDERVLAYLRKKGCPTEMLDNRNSEARG